MIIFFSFIMLFVEINVSQCVLVWLSKVGIINLYNYYVVEDVLCLVVYMYVVVVFSLLVILIYYIMIYMGCCD